MSKARLKHILETNRIIAIPKTKVVNGEKKQYFKFEPVGAMARFYWRNKQQLKLKTKWQTNLLNDLVL